MENYYRRKGLNSITIGVDVCKLHYNVGTCLRHVSNALINWRFCNHCCLHRNMPKAKALKKSAGGDIAVFLLITYGCSQLSIIGGSAFSLPVGCGRLVVGRLRKWLILWWFY